MNSLFFRAEGVCNSITKGRKEPRVPERLEGFSTNRLNAVIRLVFSKTQSIKI